jgi:hypothetical protein
MFRSEDDADHRAEVGVRALVGQKAAMAPSDRNSCVRVSFTPATPDGW